MRPFFLKRKPENNQSSPYPNLLLFLDPRTLRRRREGKKSTPFEEVNPPISGRRVTTGVPVLMGGGLLLLRWKGGGHLQRLHEHGGQRQQDGPGAALPRR